MTHFTRFIYFFVLYLSFFSCFWLAGCKTKSCSVASASQSATASETASRRTFSHNTDSFVTAFTLSIDSFICSAPFDESTTMSQLAPFPATPTSAQHPKRHTFYGVHIVASVKENIAHTDSLVSREDKSTQNNISKESYSKNTPPTSTNHYLFFIYIVVIVCIIMYLKKRFQ